MIIGLIHTAAVYTPNTTTGEYSVLAKSNLPCRLTYTQSGAAATGNEHANIGENRRLLWSDEYEMPDDAQVEVDSVRWNVRPGTYGAPAGPYSDIAYRRCELTKVLS